MANLGGAFENYSHTDFGATAVVTNMYRLQHEQTSPSPPQWIILNFIQPSNLYTEAVNVYADTR